MTTRNNVHLLKILTLSMAAMACSSIANLVPTKTPTVTPTQTLRPTPTITTTPSYQVETGETITILSGGFSFSQIKGYKVVGTDNLGVYLVSPDEKLEVLVFASPRPSGTAIAGILGAWMEDLDNDYGNFVHTGAVIETNGELESITSEFTGINNESPV